VGPVKRGDGGGGLPRRTRKRRASPAVAVCSGWYATSTEMMYGLASGFSSSAVLSPNVASSGTDRGLREDDEAVVADEEDEDVWRRGWVDDENPWTKDENVEERPRRPPPSEGRE
jgi:hypothetical protein